jgi:hypothetical protein
MSKKMVRIESLVARDSLLNLRAGLRLNTSQHTQNF